MDQVDATTYKVKLGEKVTVQITGHGVPNEDGTFATMPPGTSNPVTGIYEFVVTRPAGKDHLGRMSGLFRPASPVDARFTSRISGSQGGAFDGPTIKKSHALKFADFTFEVKS